MTATEIDLAIANYHRLRVELEDREAELKIELAGTVPEITLTAHMRQECIKRYAQLREDYIAAVILYEQLQASLREREVVAHEELSDFYSRLSEARN